MTSDTELNPYAPPQATLEDARGGVDPSFKLNLFSAAGRIGRIRYLGYSIGLSFLIMVVGGILSVLAGPWMMALAYVAAIYAQVMLTIKRSHDFNTSGWLALLVLVPVISLVFLFIPGTDGPNRFGNKTAPNGGATMFVIIALVGVMLIGILAAIAIPAYQNYVNRAGTAQVR